MQLPALDEGDGQGLLSREEDLQVRRREHVVDEALGGLFEVHVRRHRHDPREVVRVARVRDVHVGGDLIGREHLKHDALRRLVDRRGCDLEARARHRTCRRTPRRARSREAATRTWRRKG